MSSIELNTSKPAMEGFAELQAAMSDPNWLRPQHEFEQANPDWQTAFVDCLESPVGFHPPLSQSVFVGDRVAIVLQSDLPAAQQVVECLLRRLMDTNIEPADITVVIAASMAAQFGITNNVEGTPDGTDHAHPLDDEFRPVKFLVHDATDEHGVAYIAANEEGLPVKVNRAIVDADVILPIGCPQPGDNDHLVDCIYPEFCVDETRQRYQDRIGSVKDRANEIQLANDHLGAFYSIQVVAGAGGQIINSISGDRLTAINDATEQTKQAWKILPIANADTAVVTIETNANQQSWRDFAKALIAANAVANGSGPIVIWSTINDRPKSEIRKALNESFESSTRAKLSRQMQQVAGIAAERQIFLKSRLSQSMVEEIGLGYVSSVDDILRLLEGQANGVFLRDAHLCQIQLKLENADAE